MEEGYGPGGTGTTELPARPARVTHEQASVL